MELLFIRVHYRIFFVRVSFFGVRYYHTNDSVELPSEYSRYTLKPMVALSQKLSLIHI